jgi:hypothetical protein
MHQPNNTLSSRYYLLYLRPIPNIIEPAEKSGDFNNLYFTDFEFRAIKKQNVN